MIDRLLDTTNIRRAFATDYDKWNIILPTVLYPYGKFNHEDSGWGFVYAFDIDDNHKPCLNILSFHRMTNDRYARYSIDGECLEFDCDDSDELERLYGLGDFDQYRDFDYDSDKPLVMFWERKSPFSQWYDSPFTAFGIGFNSAEQYMMYMKALLFDDYNTAEKILATKDVRKQKELGRQVKGFDEKRWQYHCRRIVYMGNKYKFLQQHHLTLTLLGTSGSLLVEASPLDNIWGIGLSADNPEAQDMSKWNGKNRLGYILSMLRDDITYEIEHREGWEQEAFVDKPLEDWQYELLTKSYYPDWDCRYSPTFMGGYFYISRSGFWVKKFKYVKQTDGLWHITENYTTEKEKGQDLLADIFAYGYFEPKIWTTSDAKAISNQNRYE